MSFFSKTAMRIEVGSDACTLPVDSPSPPRRSRTSAAVLGIIKDVDHELKTSASSNSMDVDDFVNPYESQGPKPPPIIRSRKKVSLTPAGGVEDTKLMTCNSSFLACNKEACVAAAGTSQEVSAAE